MDFKKALPDMSANLQMTGSGGGYADNGGTVNLNQPIMLDGRTITTIVSQIQYQQGRATLRNLGTT